MLPFSTFFFCDDDDDLLNVSSFLVGARVSVAKNSSGLEIIKIQLNFNLMLKLMNPYKFIQHKQIELANFCSWISQLAFEKKTFYSNEV